MALLLIEGFEHVSSSLYKWAPSYWNSARTGDYGGSLNGTYVSKVLTPSGGFVIGAAIRMPSPTAGWGSVDLLRLQEGSTIHLTLSSNGSERLCVKCGSTVLQTGITPLVGNNWYYIEFKGVIDAAAGSFEVHIDGVVEIVGTGVTRNGGVTGQWNQVALGGSGHDWDDIYVCDLSGTTNKDFLGNCRVQTMLPVLDSTLPGTHRDWTPLTGTDHGLMVFNPAPNTTTYNSAATPGQIDTYHLDAPAHSDGSHPPYLGGGAIAGVQTSILQRVNDIGLRGVCTVVRTSGVDYLGPSVNGLTGFQYLTEMRTLNPATGVAWTQADINGLEVGMQITA